MFPNIFLCISYLRILVRVGGGGGGGVAGVSFRENKALHFICIVSLADNSYEMQSLIFSENKIEFCILLSALSLKHCK